MDCQVIKIGGHTDHVHMLCLLSKKVALVNLLEDLKSYSSKWVKTQGAGLENFYWQRGYGAFSVDPSEVETLIQYISNQHVHHAKQTFQEEYRSFLEKYCVEYDEGYVWD